MKTVRVVGLHRLCQWGSWYGCVEGRWGLWIQGEGRLGRWLSKHHEVRFCIYFNFLVIVIANKNFLGSMCFRFFFQRLSSRHLKNRERWLAPRSSDRKILVPCSPALPKYTSLFFQILAKFTVTTVLVSTGVSLVLPEVDLFLRSASFFFVRFRSSFVARENFVFFNSMSRFSLTILIMWSVGFSFSSPFTTSIFCFSLLSSVSCFAFNFLISSAFILNCCFEQ